MNLLKPPIFYSGFILELILVLFIMTTQLNYKISGEGIPFVFQHGLASNLGQPQGLLSAIKGVKLISIDCPGHGDSPLAEPATPSFNFYAQQILDLMDQLKVRKAIFGGISMGAGIALNITLKSPERVSGLVLVRPAWLDQGSPGNLKILLAAAKAIQDRDKPGFMNRTDFQEIQKALPKVAESILGVFGPEQRPELPIVIENMVKDRAFDDLNSLNTIDRPCLIIGSDDDPLHPFDMAESIHQQIRSSELSKIVSRYIDDEQHRLYVNKLVTNFIKIYEK
jgi:pimeloyl-ACP methyl ester carboxylesterase